MKRKKRSRKNRYILNRYYANEKGSAQGVQEDNNLMEVRNESNKNL